MYSYLMSGIVISLQIIMIYLLGTAIFYKEKCVPYRFILGYIVYSVIIAIGGISTQILGLPWKVFFWFMIILIISIFSISIYFIKKKKIGIFPTGFKSFIKNHWFLLFICLVLTAFLFMYYLTFWYNNHLDDGYYINKMITMPYVSNPFGTNPSTGFLNGSGFNPYIVNTAEIETSFYIYLFRLQPTLYIRLFLSFFNYFVLVNLIYSFATKLIKALNAKVKPHLIQYTTAITILFGFNSVFLEYSNFMYLPDSNQFTSAMYYGSSIVRVMAILFLITPFIDNDKIDLKTVLSVSAISLMLMSKSTVALPLIIVVCLSYIMTVLLMKNNKSRLLAIGLFILLVLFGSLLTGNYDMQEYGKWKFLWAAGSYYVIFSIIILFLTFLYKSKIVVKINILLLIIMLFIFINPLNNITETTSVYVFVLGRFTATFFYTVMIIAFIYIFISFSKIHIKSLLLDMMYISLTFVLIFANIYIFHKNGADLFLPDKSVSITAALNVMKQNKYFIPDSTVKLGNELERLYKQENKELYVLMEELSVVNGTLHPIATTVRSFAPSIKSVSAAVRYPIEEECVFKSYNGNDQKCLNDFIYNPQESTFEALVNILTKYPINCIVLPSFGYDTYMKELGFQLFSQISDVSAGVEYFIYY